MSTDVNCVQKHTAVIYDRGGRQRIGVLSDLESVEWSRARNTVTSATVAITSAKCRSQIDLLRQIEPRRHELVIFRGETRVWEGPIEQVSWTSTGLVIDAFDVFNYVEHTVLSRTWNDLADMITRVAQILAYELSTPYSMIVGTGSAVQTVSVPRWENIEPAANVAPFIRIYPGSTVTTSWTEPFELTVGEHVRTLARNGIDFAAIGRSICIWDSDRVMGQTRTVTEDDFTGDIEVVSAGSGLATISHLVGEEKDDEDGNPLPTPIGHAGGENDYYGVWERLATTSSEQGVADPDPDAPQEALNALAQRTLLGRVPVPLEVRADGVDLILSDTLLLDDLVPGILVPVLATWNLREVSQMQVIDKITVIETPTGESVRPTLVPAGDVMIVEED